MGDNTHVTDVGGLVHETTDLVLKTQIILLMEANSVRYRLFLLTYCEVTTDDQGDQDNEAEYVDGNLHHSV